MNSRFNPLSWLRARLSAFTQAANFPLAGQPFSDAPTPADLYHLYRLLLHRNPDREGWQHWMSQLNQLTADDLFWMFLHTLEFRRRQAERAQALPSLEFRKPNQPEPYMLSLVSQVGTQRQVDSAIYRGWCEELKQPPAYHRKQWEVVYALQALEEAGLLQSGKCGLGFGVGKEPLPSVLAKRGCQVVATDLDIASARAQGWRGTSQHSNSVDELCDRLICDLDAFRQHVTFRTEDMNNISAGLKVASFDFVWSLCSLEHLGSLEHGLRFIKESLKCLRPGGLAIHTTEYNLSSNEDTLTTGAVVVYRQRDIEALVDELRREGYVINLNLHPGDGSLDKYYDVPPYSGGLHLKLLLDKYVITSVGLLIHKPTATGEA